MFAAFQELGVDIALVDGTSLERRTKWEAAVRASRQMIGVYSEMSTMPIGLADPDHIPRAPFQDFRNFARLRRSGVPVTAFYRDVYWRFPHYSTTVPWQKRLPAIGFYCLEAWQLARHVDHIFLPSSRMKQHVPFLCRRDNVSALPPGGKIRRRPPRPASGPLRLLYVGGIGGEYYDLSPMLQTVSMLDGVRLTLCCREAEWHATGHRIDTLRNVELVHHDGEELEQHFQQADIFLMWRRMNDYLRFAFPVKLSEAFCWGLPVITNPDCEAGDLIQRDGLGWTPATPEELSSLLLRLRDERSAIANRQAKLIKARERHSWQARAETVLSVLQACRRERN